MATPRRLTIALLLILPGMLLLPLTWQPGLRTTDTTLRSDLIPHLIYHELIQAGHWPWLNPHTGLSRPLAADPQYAAWYPPTWIHALTYPTETLPLILWIHYALLVWGAYRLARLANLTRRLATTLAATLGLLGALAIAWLPLTTFCTLAWTPLVLWSLSAYARSPATGPSSVLRLALAALLLTLQTLAGAPQLALLTAIAAIALMLLSRRATAPVIFTRWLITCVCALGLGAIQWLPLLAIMPCFDDHTTLSTPLRQIPTQPPEPNSRLAGVLRALRTSNARLWVVSAPPQNTTPIGTLTTRLNPRANVLHRIPTLRDPGPLQPTAQREYLGFTWHPTPTDRDRLLHDPRWMRCANVGWTLLTEPDQPPPADAHLVLTTRADERLYRHPLAGGWAMFADGAQPGVVRCLQRSPNQITIRVDTWPAGMNQPAPDSTPEHTTIVISQLALPGWSATLDGHPLPLRPHAGLFLSLRVPVGKCLDIQLAYFPPGVFAGLLITALCAVALAGAVLFTLLTPHPPPTTPPANLSASPATPSGTLPAPPPSSPPD